MVVLLREAEHNNPTIPWWSMKVSAKVGSVEHVVIKVRKAYIDSLQSGAYLQSIPLMTGRKNRGGDVGSWNKAWTTWWVYLHSTLARTLQIS